MTHHRNRRWALPHNWLGLFCLLALGSTPLNAEITEMKREMLMEKPVELPSNAVNAKMIRVTFPPKFITPWHEHKGPGPRYILKGSLKVTEGGETHTYQAGDVFWESGQRMRVENLSADTAELVIFELDRN